MWQFAVLLATVSAVALSGINPDIKKQQIQDEELQAQKYLDYVENEFNRRANRASLVRWAYASNITDANLKNQVITPIYQSYTSKTNSRLASQESSVCYKTWRFIIIFTRALQMNSLHAFMS